MAVLHWILIISSFVPHCLGTGSVFIGSASTNVTLYTFTVSFGGSIPVLIDAVNTTTPLVGVPINGQVRVTCEASYLSAGFSNVTFSNTLLSDGNRSGNVTLSNLQAGRDIEIRCFGVSITAGETQFTKATSISEPVTLRILNQPVISVCADNGFLRVTPNTAINQSFTVEFSDVTTSTIQINCTVTPTAATNIRVNFLANSAATGVFTHEITYNYVSGTTPSILSCRAAGYVQGGSVELRLNTPALTFYPQNVVTTATKFSLLLQLTLPPEDVSSITLSCRADHYNNLTVANIAVSFPPCSIVSPTTPPPVTTPSGTPAPTTVPTIPDWGVLQVSPLEPGNNNYHRNVRVARNIPATANVREYVVTSCCTNGLSSNFNTAVLTVVDLTVNKTINYIQGTALLSINTERKYQNPAFVNVSPCPCDQTGNLCDINCCCDEDCSAQDQETFSRCTEGLPGGRSPPLPDWNCDSSYYDQPDYFPLMCVEFEYNALLGFFYATTDAVRNSQNYERKKSGEEFYSYSRSEITSTERQSYKDGASVRSVKLLPGNSVNPQKVGIVALPQRTLGGECLKTAPVRYLNDLNTNCNFRMTADMCTSASVFSSRFYMESSNIRDPACPNSFSVIGNSSSNRLGDTTVNYFCSTTINVSDYVKATTSVPSVTTFSLFDYIMPNSTCSDTCGNDICTDFNSIPDPAAGSGLPNRCSFDNGYTRAPEPRLNGNVCENVVLDVRYNFFWRASVILQLNATVILGNVQIGSVVTQKYSAMFNHNFGGDPLNATDNYSNVTTAFARSGKPGYAYEKPVLSGSRVVNSTSSSFLYVNTNRSRQLALWDTGINGLCFNAGRRSLSFGIDMFSSCIVRLSAANFSNCDGLRKLVINRLNNLMAADRIGRFGNSDFQDDSQWIEIFRDDLSTTCQERYNQTDEVVLSYSLGGLCPNIISGINIDIMYGESGRAYDQPIKEIIGARISYTNSTWQLSCSVGSSGTCNSTSYTEAFEVTSSVRFIKVPANTPEPIQMYDQYDYLFKCKRDICWEEFIYPLSGAYDAENQQYVLGMVLVVIVFIVGLAVLMRPYWYII